MKFDQLLAIVADEPVFETGLLLAGSVNPSDMRRQLVRWTQAGRLHQLRRGLYALAPPYRQTVSHPSSSPIDWCAALMSASVGVGPRWYDSRVRAEMTSVTGGRPQLRQTPLGRFSFATSRPICSTAIDKGNWRVASRFVATPEKALLDLIYLQPNGDTPAYIKELRLDWGAST